MLNTTVGCVFTNDVFGTTTPNTSDIAFINGSFNQIEWASPSGNAVVDTTNLSTTADGTHLRISDYNDTLKDDRGWLTYGRYQRTHSSLSDTLVRTTGGSALRIAPTGSTNKVKWKNNILTTNIQTRTMTVSVWVYINNTAYDAGVFTLPTLRVNYDDGTEVTSVATAIFGSWQQLALIFTPTTTFPQITATIEAATDALTTDAYFYVDDYNIAFPAGINIDNGSLDNWANALPVTPPTAQVVASLGGVCDEAVAAHTVPGTYGQILKSQRGATAQSGTATTITLDASASAVNDYYTGSLIYLTDGPGSGQARIITAYVGSTKVATVATWSTTPDVTSRFAIVPFSASLTPPTAVQIRTEIDANSTKLDVAVSTRQAESSASTRAATDVAEHDTTQAAIAALTVAPSAATVRDAILDADLSNHSTTNSPGKFIKEIRKRNT